MTTSLLGLGATASFTPGAVSCTLPRALLPRKTLAKLCVPVHGAAPQGRWPA